MLLYILIKSVVNSRLANESQTPLPAPTTCKTLYDPVIDKKGIEKKTIEIVKKAIEMGMNNDIIIELTCLTDEEINDIRKELSH